MVIFDAFAQIILKGEKYKTGEIGCAEGDLGQKRFMAKLASWEVRAKRYVAILFTG